MLHAATRETTYIGFLNKIFIAYHGDSLNGGASLASSKFLNNGSGLRRLIGSRKNITINMIKISDKAAIQAKGKLYS